MLLKLGWRNLWRRPRRTLLTATAMGLALALSMGAITLQSGIQAALFNEMVTDTLAHLQLHHPDYPREGKLHQTLSVPPERLDALRADPATALVTARLLTFALAGGERQASGALVSGVLPSEEDQLSELSQELREGGRWLSAHATNEAVLGAGLAEELELSLGDELALVTQDSYGATGSALYEVVGLVDSGSVALDQGGVWIHLGALQELLVLEEQAHQILITGDPAWEDFRPNVTADLQRLKEHIAERPALAAAALQTWREARPSTASFVEAQEKGAYMMLILVFIAAAFGILNTMLMAVFERQRELSLLLSLGLGPARIFALVISEALLLALIAALFGLALGGAFNLWLIDQGIDFSVDGGAGLSYGGVRLDPVIRGVVEFHWITKIVIAHFTVTLLSSLWPALRAARSAPLAGLRGDS